jgi:site-specific DNA-methyltransferase (adenine-specific)
MNKSTKTSFFGNPGRINHDSTVFYDSRMYKNIKIKSGNNSCNYNESIPLLSSINKIYCKSSITMEELPDNSVHLIVTSPPYNVKKEYDKDLSLDEYRRLLIDVFSEVYKKLVSGGRVCINIANVGRKPYIPLHSYLIEDMIRIGYSMRGEIIWNKAASAGTSTAWGSWKSAANPVLRDIHEYILIFSKEKFSRNAQNKENTISKEEFLEYTKSIWTFPTVSAKAIGHPAPFPDELPERLIKLFTFKSDVVLDPFCGSGTTCIAAVKNKRFYVGYDNVQKYVDIAIKRINQYLYENSLFNLAEKTKEKINNEYKVINKIKKKKNV